MCGGVAQWRGRAGKYGSVGARGKVVLREDGINEVDRGINSGFKTTKEKSVGKSVRKLFRQN